MERFIEALFTYGKILFKHYLLMERFYLSIIYLWKDLFKYYLLMEKFIYYILSILIRSLYL